MLLTHISEGLIHQTQLRLQYQVTLRLTRLLQLQKQGWQLTEFRLHPHKITNQTAGLKYREIQTKKLGRYEFKKDKNVVRTLDQKVCLIHYERFQSAQLILIGLE
jgi:hypothetical protein